MKIVKTGTLVSSYRKGKEDERDRILDNELNMRCLVCSKSLHKKIMNRKIHIHICDSCRKPLLNKIQNNLMKELRKNEEISRNKP